MEGIESNKTLRFADVDAQSDYVLFEMTEEMLRELQTSGQFSIKGAESEEAVLCTASSSFAIREAPSSNSMLLMTENPLKSFNDCTTVLKTLHGAYILNRTMINMEKLKSLLSSAPISSSETGVSSRPLASTIGSLQLYTYQDLEATMQASPKELDEALRSIDAFEFGGYFRIFDTDSEHIIAKHILLSIIAEGHSLERLHKQDVARASNDGRLNAALVEQGISTYLATHSESTDSNPLYYFNTRKYSSLVAEVVLRKHDTGPESGVRLSQFKDEWQKLATDYLTIDMDDLQGLAVLEEVGKTDFKVRYLPTRSMSHSPKIRLAELFKVKPKWTFAQIKPYLQDLMTHDTNEEKILVQHARSSNGPDGTSASSATAGGSEAIPHVLPQGRSTSKSFLASSVSAWRTQNYISSFKSTPSTTSRSYCTAEVEPEAPVSTRISKHKTESRSGSRGAARQASRSNFMKRVADDDGDAEAFGLDQFAARIHLGKPAGSKHDVVLDPLRLQLLDAAQTRDSATSKSLLESTLAAHPEVFAKIETKGRLLWLILRAKPAQYSANAPTFETRLWAATHMVDVLAHGERAGYLWGVLLDALNRSDLLNASELVWARIDTLLTGERRLEFLVDEQFLLVARLAGLIDSFKYSNVVAILTRLNACAGPDIAAWAFTRCLSKYIMSHQNVIATLPNWLGSDLSDIVPFRAAHLAPLLADAGCVDAARAYWLKDNTSLYSSTSDKVPANLAEARLESEHLRAGLIVFARHPQLEAPHDEILRIIYSRFEMVLKEHPTLAQHNHGLLYFLARSNFYNLNAKLSKLFLELGSSPTIVSTAMVTMCIRLGDFRRWREWVHIRSPEDNEISETGDRFAWWLFKSVSSPFEEVANFRLPVGLKLPLMFVTFADRLIYQRYLLGLSPEAETPKTTAEIPFGSPIFTDVALPHVVTEPRSPISSEAYYNWSKMLASFNEKNMIGKEDLHSFHRTLLSFTASGEFDHAEHFILSEYRSAPPKQDTGIAFLLAFYAYLNLFPRMVSFVAKVNKRHPNRTIDTFVGETKLVELFKLLESQGADPVMILQLWSLCNAPTVIAFTFPVLVKCVITLRDTVSAATIATQLSSRGVHSQSGAAVRSALQLREWLYRNRCERSADRLDKWLRNVKSKFTS